MRQSTSAFGLVLRPALRVSKAVTKPLRLFKCAWMGCTDGGAAVAGPEVVNRAQLLEVDGFEVSGGT